MRVLQYVLAAAFVKVCQLIDLYDELKIRLYGGSINRNFEI
ncbi:MAG: hypothetical protein ACOH1O_13585 [Flavobacterium sp.]